MFDPYYETKVNPRWSNSKIGSFLGSLLTFVGAAMAIFSIVDLARGNSGSNGSAWQENSIWPTIGKGIWVGAFLVGTGIIGIISSLERTHVSLYVFNALTWISSVLSLYTVLSSILHIQAYMVTSYSTTDSRSYAQNIEVAMNALLITCGSLGFIISTAAGFLSCIAGNCCVNHRKYSPLNQENSPPAPQNVAQPVPQAANSQPQFYPQYITTNQINQAAY